MSYQQRWICDRCEMHSIGADRPSGFHKVYVVHDENESKQVDLCSKCLDFLMLEIAQALKKPGGAVELPDYQAKLRTCKPPKFAMTFAHDVEVLSKFDSVDFHLIAQWIREVDEATEGA